VAIPATSFTAISTHAATIETRAVRRCGLMRAEGSHGQKMQKGPPLGEPFGWTLRA